MKYLQVVAILLLVCGFTIANTFRLSPALEWILKKKVTNFQPKSNSTHSNRIYRRQSDDSIPFACFNEFVHLTCETGFVEKIVRIELNCGRNANAQFIAAQCDINSNGELCDLYEFFIETDPSFGSAQEACLPAVNGECPSPECATSLSNLLTSQPGCCIDALYNFTGSEVETDVFNYTLWYNCEIPPFTTCERQISRTPLQNATECTDDEAERQILMVECSKEFSDILDQVMLLEPCTFIQLRDIFSNSCMFNSQGDFCELLTDQAALNLNTASSECRMGQTSCSIECREALESFKSELGCCGNMIYNGTAKGGFVTSYTLWSQCGVETPPLLCQNALNGTTPGPVSRTTPVPVTRKTPGPETSTSSAAHHISVAILTFLFTLLVTMNI